MGVPCGRAGRGEVALPGGRQGERLELAVVLAELGVAETLSARAGPLIARVAVFAGAQQALAPLPDAALRSATAGGRALGREHLDTALLDAARRAGATVLQPFSLVAFDTDAERVHCTIAERGSPTRWASITAPLLVAAHGSWERLRKSVKKYRMCLPSMAMTCCNA